jgi:hypothetical protein
MHALMLGSRAAHWATIAGPHKTEIIIEERFIFLVFPNNREKVRHEIIPAISLKNTFKTPMLYLLDGMVVFTG